MINCTRSKLSAVCRQCSRPPPLPPSPPPPPPGPNNKACTAGARELLMRSARGAGREYSLWKATFSRVERGHYTDGWPLRARLLHLPAATSVSLESNSVQNTLCYESMSCEARAQELHESRGGRPGLPAPESLYGLRGCKEILKLNIVLMSSP